MGKGVAVKPLQSFRYRSRVALSTGGSWQAAEVESLSKDVCDLLIILRVESCLLICCEATLPGFEALATPTALFLFGPGCLVFHASL
eukprot:Skav225473  [mRNA]  locus=scaffold881:313430:315501:- [translate_table: standard]